MQQQLKDWSEAKERLSVEIARKIEGHNEGTKFEKARGFVRKNFSSKNFDPNLNPLLEDTSSSSGEENEAQTMRGNLKSA
jgi:hypothetical protein